MARDFEKEAQPKNHLIGFPSLASFMVKNTDHSTLIYNRFDGLSARNILYLQSELAELQGQQDEFDREDFWDIETNGKEFARNWKEFENASQEEGSKPQRRMALVKKIREKIKEYKQAIMLDADVLSLRRPSKQTFKAFNKIFTISDGGTGDVFPVLGGSSASVYAKRNDLIGLVRPLEEDRLTIFLRKHCSALFLETSPDRDLQIAYISARRIALFVGFINVLLAASFLFGAIYNLYYVEKIQIKLGLIAGYTIAIALCLNFTTTAKRSEIFGVCAAYAAVLVVFVSSGFGNKAVNGP